MYCFDTSASGDVIVAFVGAPFATKSVTDCRVGSSVLVPISTSIEMKPLGFTLCVSPVRRQHL